MKTNTPVKPLLLGLLLCASTVFALDLMPADPDWREETVPPPPAVRSEGLIPLEIPGSSLRFGVDPASIAIGNDRIVRYVVVASASSGAVNALYEGIRCNTGQFKVYARYTPAGWTATPDVQWRSLHEPPISRHSLQVARQGICVGNGTNTSVTQMVRDLRSPVATRLFN